MQNAKGLLRYLGKKKNKHENSWELSSIRRGCQQRMRDLALESWNKSMKNLEKKAEKLLDEALPRKQEINEDQSARQQSETENLVKLPVLIRTVLGRKN